VGLFVLQQHALYICSVIPHVLTDTCQFEFIREGSASVSQPAFDFLKVRVELQKAGRIVSYDKYEGMQLFSTYDTNAV